MIRAICFLALSVLLIGASPLMASSLTYLEDAESLGKDGKEVSLEVTFDQYKRQGNYNSQEFQLGYAYGIKDDLDFGISLIAYKHNYAGDPVPDEIDGSLQKFRLAGLEAGFKKSFSEASLDNLGFAWVGGLVYEGVDDHSGLTLTKWQLVNNLILEKQFSEQVSWLNNFELELEREVEEGELEQALQLTWASGVNYQLNDSWHLGLEGYYDFKFIKEEKSSAYFDHWALFAGPSIGYEFDDWSVAFNLMFQLAGTDERQKSSISRHLDDHEKYNARLVIAREF